MFTCEKRNRRFRKHLIKNNHHFTKQIVSKEQQKHNHILMMYKCNKLAFIAFNIHPTHLWLLQCNSEPTHQTESTIASWSQLWNVSHLNCWGSSDRVATTKSEVVQKWQKTEQLPNETTTKAQSTVHSTYRSGSNTDWWQTKRLFVHSGDKKKQTRSLSSLPPANTDNFN